MKILAVLIGIILGIIGIFVLIVGGYIMYHYAMIICYRIDDYFYEQERKKVEKFKRNL